MSSDVGQEVIEVAAAEQLEDDESNEAADETIEHAGIKDHDDAPYSSEFADGDAEEKEEDFNDELDADRIHDGDDAAHEVDREEERQTEYSEEVVPEDDDDGYEGEGFNEEGSESGGGEFDNEFQEEEDAEEIRLPMMRRIMKYRRSMENPSMLKRKVYHILHPRLPAVLITKNLNKVE